MRRLAISPEQITLDDVICEVDKKEGQEGKLFMCMRELVASGLGLEFEIADIVEYLPNIGLNTVIKDVNRLLVSGIIGVRRSFELIKSYLSRFWVDDFEYSMCDSAIARAVENLTFNSKITLISCTSLSEQYGLRDSRYRSGNISNQMIYGIKGLVAWMDQHWTFKIASGKFLVHSWDNWVM